MAQEAKSPPVKNASIVKSASSSFARTVSAPKSCLSKLNNQANWTAIGKVTKERNRVLNEPRISNRTSNLLAQLKSSRKVVGFGGLK